MKKLIALIALITGSFYCNAQVLPYLYYTFDGAQPNACDPTATCTATCSLSGNAVTTTPGIVGDGMIVTPQNPSYTADKNGYSGPNFTVEFFMKLDENFDKQKSCELFRFENCNAVLEYDGIYFNTSALNGTTPVDDIWHLLLDGIGIKSIDYYANSWHHIVFIYNGTTGVKEIWVDKQNPSEFRRTGITTATALSITNNFDFGINLSGTSNAYANLSATIDELAIYQAAITGQQVVCDYANILAGNHYGFSISCGVNIPTPNQVTGIYSDLEFCSGTDHSQGIHSSDFIPDTKFPAIQLKSFATPRFKPNHTLLPNSSWLGMTYMSGIGEFLLGTTPQTLNDIVNASLTIQYDLAKNWNYYYVVNENTNINDYGSTTQYNQQLINAWVNFATTTNENFKYQANAYRGQISTTGTGYATPDGKSWISSQQLADNFYCGERASAGSPPINFLGADGNVSSTKFISPKEFPNPSIANDGYVQAQLLNDLKSQMGTKWLSMLGENNEVGAIYVNYSDQSATCGSAPNNTDMPKAFCLDADIGTNNSSSLSWLKYQSEKKKQLDVNYQNIFLNDVSLNLGNTIFQNYRVDGAAKYLPNRIGQHDYAEIRQTQKPINGKIYSTPDFYPASPLKWRSTQGPRHSWEWLNFARDGELDAGDDLYSPFVCAGFNTNEENVMRPGQFLGLLKSLGMLGVDFFNVGYFNEGLDLVPPQGVDEFINPKGWVWQATSSPYAQAILSRGEEFIRNGSVMRGDVPIELTNPASGIFAFNFACGNPNALITARQLTGFNKYFICGALQTLSNEEADPVTGIVQQSKLVQDVTFNLTPTIKVKMQARKQGSVYIFDNSSAANPIFYQVDKWHDWTHPEYWTKDFDFEAEVFDNNINTPSIATIDNTTNAPVVAVNGVLDFTNSTSFASFTSASQQVEFSFQPRTDGVANNYNFYMKARSTVAGGSSCKIELMDANGVVMQTSNIKCVAMGGWQWYKKDACPPYNDIVFNNLTDDGAYKIIVTSNDANLQIDRIYLDAGTPETFFTPLSSGCAYTATFNNGSNLSSQTVPAGSLVAVNGTVVCTSALTFTNCTFAMSGSAAINVNAGGNLTFTNCTFYSVCNSMWNGITNNGGIVTMTGCNVQDAIGALETSNGSQVTVTGNTFNHNYSSLRFIGGSYASSTVYGNTFDNTGAQLTKAPYSGKDQPYHVYAENVTLLDIGKVGFAQNEFYNAERGIFSGMSNVNVYNNHFENIGDNNYQQRLAAGNVTPISNRNLFAAVCAGSSRANEVTLNVGNGTAPASNTFFNCQRGVFTQFKVNTWVDLNNFNQCTQGIIVSDVDAPNVVIRNNTINRFSEGVTLYQVVNNPWVNIINNQFNSGIGYDPSYYGTAAINIRNYSLQGGSYYTISGNTMGNTEKGIHLQNVAAYIGGPGGYAGLLIKANTINQVIPNSDLTSFHYGIWTENCVGVNIFANNVLRNTNGGDPNFVSLAPQQDLMRGISIDQTSRSTVKDNRTQNMGTDIRVLGSCIGANIRCNRMQSSFQGIKFLSANITTGTSYGSLTDPTDNSWENNYLTNTNDRTTGSFSSGLPLDWYHRNDLSGNSVVAQNLYCPYYPLVGKPVTPFGNANGAWNCNHNQQLTDDEKDEMLRIAQNQVTYDEFAQENQFYNKEFTYNNLDDNPALMNSGSAQDAWLQQFYNAEKTGNTGKIKDVKDYIAIKDKQQAQLKNLSIVDNTLLLQNLKLANTIYLNHYFEVDTPTVDSLTLLQLYNLAYQNGIQGGEGVYMARAMLNLDVEDAVNVMRMAQSQTSKKDNDVFACKVYPNPSTGIFYVSYLLDVNKTGNFVLTDATGRNLKEVKLNQNSSLLKIDFTSYEGGVYYYQFNNGNKKQSGKIVIVK